MIHLRAPRQSPLRLIGFANLDRKR